MATQSIDRENTLLITLATGDVMIELWPDIAPNHVDRIKTLTRAGEYDNVAWHRVIDGFVAQTGDVQFGNLEDGFDPSLVGTGNSDLGMLDREFSDVSFTRGVLGMARAGDPLARFGFPERDVFLDSADSQFFIVFDQATFLDGAYTAFGQVVEGMDLIDAIQRVDRDSETGTLVDPTGALIAEPDRMVDVEVYADLFGLGLTEAEAREVALLYEAGLDRNGEIDLPGLNFWIDAREGVFSIAAIAQFFIDSAEFAAAYGDPDLLSDAAFVDQLYFNVLDREGDAAGREFWTGQAEDPAVSRADLLVAFSTSVENAETSAFINTLMECEPGDWAFV